MLGNANINIWLNKQSRFKNKKLVGALLLVVALLAMGMLEAFNVTHVFHSSNARAVTTTASPATKGIKPADNSKDKQPATGSTPSTGTQSQGQPNSPDGPVKQNATSNNTNLAAPSGTFANIYKDVSLSENMQSTCNTTPGATCQIIFTRGSLTKSLPLKSVDNGGAAYWSWKPNDSNVGLSVGTWHITARATLGSQTQTTDNGSLELEITQ